RYDVTGVYRGFHVLSDGTLKPRDEFGVWAYNKTNPKILTLQPGTLDVELVDEKNFIVLPQQWGHKSVEVFQIHQGSGFFKDTFMEMTYLRTKVGDDTSPPLTFTFRGVK